MGDMDSIIAEFLAESVENLDQLDQDLVSLEKNPSDREIFTRIFRTIHTIKGTCGFLAFQNLESVTHVGESVLSRLRDGTLDLSPEITSDLLAMIDAVRSILANIDRTGSEGDDKYSDLIARLKGFDKNAAAGGKKKRHEPVTEPEGDPETLELTSTPAVAESSLRVDVRVLDHLMNLVGELVLARNQLVQHLSGSPDPLLVASSLRLDGVTGELQEAVMQTRMQPISTIWNKLPRFVRDLALGFDKKVEIQMEGQETDLDKSVIEAIKGSLLHLVRNAVDHGIEAPEVREARGKPPVGTLRLRAHHEGGNVVIEVKDDGGGLDHERILARAVKADLVSKADEADLTPREIEAFIFHPGFSTAAKVTNISGRGVGLDVVRTNVESIGGSVELKSEPGESTTFRVKIPLTLAIVSALLVRAGENRVAIPQANVVELVRLEGKGSDLGIEDLNGVPVYRLRGSLLPLVFLDDELQIGDGMRNDSAANIVVLQGDDRRFGLVVDTIDDSIEIVVKPLGRLLADVPFAGATILGDGRIALILDIMRLGLGAGVISEARTHAVPTEAEVEPEAGSNRETLLCLQGADNERLAVDFAKVARLESFPRSAIETVAGQQVVQYGDEILQLVDLQQTLPERRKRARSAATLLDEDVVPVVVFTIDGQRAGLIVHRIVDVVEEELKALRPGSRPGVRACAVIQGRVTEIIDLESVTRLADPEFFSRATEAD
ncbi:MAG: chemotaxis protein CheW [Thermoanaerobaculales bacterium]